MPEPEAMGHGVNQRSLVAMTPAEVDAFLAENHTMSMATLNADGSIHLVAMWYGFVEGAVAIESKAKAQKIVNLRRNPAVTVMAEAGETYDQLRGVQISGRAEIITDPARMFELGVSMFERYTAPYTPQKREAVERMLHKRVVVKVDPVRVRSWDHRKLGLPPMPRRQD
jgi:PPOX class probable F420-dependent enzyme